MLCQSSARQLSKSVGRSLSKRLPAAAATTTTTTTTKRFESTSSSPWTDYEMAPFDPIIGLNEQFKMDDFPQKQNLGVGAYRDDAGKPWVLPCVREAEKILLDSNLDMEYSGIAGDPKFVELALKFGYGEDSKALNDGRIQGVQALSGTGGLRVMGELLRKHGHTQIYVPTPTWGNHIPIFGNSGLEVKKYRYYDAVNSKLDFDGMIEDIRNMPNGVPMLLHACAHNPTGMDPTLEQWAAISETIKSKNVLPFFDAAYQGFASGDMDRDAAAVRMFVEDGHYMAMVQSFSKNFGMYGHRIGALSVVGGNDDEAKRVASQMKLVIRPMYSNPPRYGARVVSTVLGDPRLYSDFKEQCHSMASRITSMRTELRTKLSEAGSTRDWDHITRQIGMFAFSGLNKDQVMEMRNKHHIYSTLDGRISMAGVTSGNVEYVANAIHDVSK